MFPKKNCQSRSSNVNKIAQKRNNKKGTDGRPERTRKGERKRTLSKSVKGMGTQRISVVQMATWTHYQRPTSLIHQPSTQSLTRPPSGPSSSLRDSGKPIFSEPGSCKPHHFELPVRCRRWADEFPHPKLYHIQSVVWDH